VLLELDGGARLTALGASATTVVGGESQTIRVGESVPWSMGAGE